MLKSGTIPIKAFWWKKEFNTDSVLFSPLLTLGISGIEAHILPSAAPQILSFLNLNYFKLSA
jgi:hypothetical protein